jgi:hypothetical protein
MSATALLLSDGRTKHPLSKLVATMFAKYRIRWSG